MGDWLEDKAKEWFQEDGERTMADIPSLVVLLREVREDYAKQGFYDLQVKERASLLAEVRRVVKDVRDSQRPPGHPFSGRNTCDEILSRLEKL